MGKENIKTDLFDGLPLAYSCDEYEKIKIQYSKWDDDYVKYGCDKDIRNNFNRLWLKFKDYADSDFQKKIKTDFHQCSWEMYICNALLNKGMCIVNKKDDQGYTQNEGPDFIIKDLSGEAILYIECIAPTHGTGDDKVPRKVVSTLGKEQPKFQYLPEDKIILRITSSLKTKSEQYDRWCDKQWFNPLVPYVVAVSTGYFGYIQNPELPYGYKAISGANCPYVKINTETGKKTGKGIAFRDSVLKSSGRGISVGNSLITKYQNISGFLFSNIMVLDQPENFNKECDCFYNPDTDKPLRSWFANL